MMKIIKDFLDFLEIRKLVEFANPLESEDDIRYIVNRCNEETELRINALILYELQKMMIKWDLSPEWVRWFKSATNFRLMMLNNNRKLIDKK